MKSEVERVVFGDASIFSASGHKYQSEAERYTNDNNIKIFII